MNPVNSGICFPCDSSCATCSGGLSNQCVTCPIGFFVVSGSCVTCDSSCATCSGNLANQCVTCYSGHFLSGGSCLACDSSCATCSGTTATRLFNLQQQLLPCEWKLMLSYLSLSINAIYKWIPTSMLHELPYQVPILGRKLWRYMCFATHTTNNQHV